ncbi:MAG: DNA-3-methyladenine glycosylase 2 family protein [Planctomycetota bacterium]|nr:DNA-3-methyladenine glycosylase 2 family protein [Planctomycetota bacterium]
MESIGDAAVVKRAVQHLRKSDSRLAAVIDRVGKFELTLRSDRFGSLVRSILAQQISTSAAKSICKKAKALMPRGRFTARAVLNQSDEELRSAGISPQKLSYLRDLAVRIDDGRLKTRSLGRLDDEAVIEELTQVRGIGRWTAQMFLIFTLGRTDVFAPDDLGIRSNMQRIYELPELPAKLESETISAAWAPYRSVACWYIWRSGDIQRENEDAAKWL